MIDIGILKRLFLWAFLVKVSLFSLTAFPQESHTKTLRDEVHEKGVANGAIFSNKIVPGPYEFKNLVQESSIIVEGQVVSQDAHLTRDDTSVFTNNHFVVYQIVKDCDHQIKVKQQIVVTTPGGETTVDGGKVKVVSNIKPFKTTNWYILFLNKDQSSDSFYIPGGEFGIFHVNNEKNVVECDVGLIDSPCNKNLPEFFQALNKALKN